VSTPFLLDEGHGGSLPCLLALPRGHDARTPLLVSVHGVTRRPLEHALAFAGPALAAGAALLVPLFSEHRHRRYQRLVHPRSGRRSDLALIDTVAALCARHGLGDGPLHLFGYSAGAQFVHRFAMAHPQRVAALAVGAAGWYTWPDPALPYPLGWAGMADWLGRSPDAQAFLRLPTRVWVGDRDIAVDDALRSSPELDDLQGGSRLERARRWVQALYRACHASGLAAGATLHGVAGAGHDFAQCARRGALAESVVDFLLSPRAGAADLRGQASVPSTVSSAREAPQRQAATPS
jgi:pimeloyl-ACP methyl ester carboxylesterase